MRGHKLIMAIFCALIFIVPFQASAAKGGNWPGTRELSMRMKEAGRVVEAYRAAVSYQANSGNMVDREFVAGWIALRNLNRPDVALAHFKSMTSYIPLLREGERNVARAKAGYWLGRTLEAQGRAKDAKIVYGAAMAYSTTYYGQLSASAANVSISKAHVNQASGSFPVKDLYWHDQRARKELVLAVIREESRFKQTATSGKGARGMMQVMDGTARLVGKQEGIKIDINQMKNNEAYNIAVGSRVLGDLMGEYKNTALALTAYNAGPLRTEEWLKRFGDPRGGQTDPVDWVENIPFKETREYVQKVMGSYITYLTMSTTK
ncbi:lytic transglycosylase domain-containing protein [Rhizobium sp. MHM7A]|uniref:lytic transglycosylase domain-containing protein n=1 Tax=Rhizobium sp. MHM7A TaxID=2583233 RepID=UPI001105D1A1|nr:lytic transglycosylase domain-containing protein [Rhizobium sp. MHM7A]TLX16994.1 lytic transglycosylase domain-containing protein [Rhizobium sp. MHM7A]